MALLAPLNSHLPARICCHAFGKRIHHRGAGDWGRGALVSTLLTTLIQAAIQNVGGIQIDVFQKYSTNVGFTYLGRNVNMYKSARKLGFNVGESVQMVPYTER